MRANGRCSFPRLKQRRKCLQDQSLNIQGSIFTDPNAWRFYSHINQYSNSLNNPQGVLQITSVLTLLVSGPISLNAQSHRSPPPPPLQVPSTRFRPQVTHILSNLSTRWGVPVTPPTSFDDLLEGPSQLRKCPTYY